MWKFLTLVLVVYLLYRYVFSPPKPPKPPIPPSQEPDIFIEHEEVKIKDEKNK